MSGGILAYCSGGRFYIQLQWDRVFLNTNIVVLVFVACLNLLFNNMNLSSFF
jgi:hypothetical protein